MKKQKLNKIGFHSYEDNEQEQEQNNQSTELLTKFISAIYSPIGCTEDIVYKTSDELVYDLRETVSVNNSEVAAALLKGGYKMTFMSGKPYWALYEKSGVEY